MAAWQSALKDTAETARGARTAAPAGGEAPPPARPLDPLIAALARAVDRLEGTAG
ncbi:hypothetical protein [Tabrizicola sp.]|uniref:hypothetical protein n=1 Tax=Tabrizicola sp. TaxID=2005166 RepID=UPI002FDCD9A0